MRHKGRYLFSEFDISANDKQCNGSGYNYKHSDPPQPHKYAEYNYCQYNKNKNYDS